MILRWFLFSLQASYRFLISTCYFAHLHDLSAENMIPDLLSSAISIQKVSFRSVIAVYHCAQLVHFSTENITLKLKNVTVIDLRRGYLVGGLSLFLGSNCFQNAYNAILIDSQIVSFQFTSKFQGFPFNVLFRLSR